MSEQHPTIEIGKRYWYRWLSDWEAECGEVVGIGESYVLFKSPFRNEYGKARIVDRSKVICEAKQFEQKNAIRLWDAIRGKQ